MNFKTLMLLAALPIALAACGRPDEPGAAAAPTADAGKANHAREGESGHEEGGGHIELTAEQMEAARIRVDEAGPALIRESIPLYGAIAPNAERVREITARFPGVIRSVEKKIGDPVREGEVLARVEANESLETYAVTSPLAGVVTARNANPGEQTNERTLFTVADLSTVWVELSLFPRDIAKVRLGQGVRVSSPDTGLAADAKVVYVAPFGQAANQTITARVLLDNAERLWAPGLYVTADVTLAESTVPLAVRNTALQSLDEGTVVFVRTSEGFEPRVISIGRNDAEFSEVLSGLDGGDAYAATNSFILKAELGKGSAEHGH